MNEDQHMKFHNDRIKEYGGFKIVSTDPYGHWHVEPPKGPCPDAMIGEWTDLTKLYAKIDNYNANKEAKKVKIEGGVK